MPLQATVKFPVSYFSPFLPHRPQLDTDLEIQSNKHKLLTNKINNIYKIYKTNQKEVKILKRVILKDKNRRIIRKKKYIQIHKFQKISKGHALYWCLILYQKIKLMMDFIFKSFFGDQLPNTNYLRC